MGLLRKSCHECAMKRYKMVAVATWSDVNGTLFGRQMAVCVQTDGIPGHV